MLLVPKKYETLLLIMYHYQKLKILDSIECLIICCVTIFVVSESTPGLNIIPPKWSLLLYNDPEQTPELIDFIKQYLYEGGFVLELLGRGQRAYYVMQEFNLAETLSIQKEYCESVPTYDDLKKRFLEK